ncbi:MAG: hypothetical protein DWB48_06660 [Nitrosomonas sp.]|nr:hypothetical protein [Nitrosomonas sp.]
MPDVTIPALWVKHEAPPLGCASEPPGPEHRGISAGQARYVGYMARPTTLGELRESGWESLPVKAEIRRNAITKDRKSVDDLKKAGCSEQEIKDAFFGRRKVIAGFEDEIPADWKSPAGLATIERDDKGWHCGRWSTTGSCPPPFLKRAT